MQKSMVISRDFPKNKAWSLDWCYYDLTFVCWIGFFSWVILNLYLENGWLSGSRISSVFSWRTVVYWIFCPHVCLVGDQHTFSRRFFRWMWRLCKKIIKVECWDARKNTQKPGFRPEEVLAKGINWSTRRKNWAVILVTMASPNSFRLAKGGKYTTFRLVDWLQSGIKTMDFSY